MKTRLIAPLLHLQSPSPGRSTAYWVGGLAVGLVGAVCFSTKAIFVKLAYREFPVDAITLLTLRMLFSLPFFVLSAAMSSAGKQNIRFTPSQWIYVACIGSLGYYISSLLDFLGLQYVSAGIERLILFTYPTFVLLLSSFWLRKKIKRIEWTAVGLTYLGLLVAFVGEVKIQSSTVEFYWGSLLILACALTYATYIAGSAKLIPGIGAVKFNSYAMSFAALAVIIHFLIAGTQSLLGLPLNIYLYSFAMAIVSTVIPTYFISISINRLGPNTTAVVASIGPVSTLLQAFWILHEPFSVLQAVGTVFILAGIVVISWKPQHAEPLHNP